MRFRCGCCVWEPISGLPAENLSVQGLVGMGRITVSRINVCCFEAGYSGCKVGGWRGLGWRWACWREESSVILSLRLKAQRKTAGEGDAWQTNPQKSGKPVMYKLWQSAGVSCHLWYALRRFTLPCLLLSVFDGQRSRFLPVSSLGNKVWVSFLTWWLASFVIQKGPPCTMWATLCSQLNAILHVGLWPKGKCASTESFGMRSQVTGQVYPWSLLLCNAIKWGEGSCKYSCYVLSVWTVE